MLPIQWTESVPFLFSHSHNHKIYDAEMGTDLFSLDLTTFAAVNIYI